MGASASHSSDEVIVIVHWQWMLDVGIGLIFLILNVLILRKELKKRSTLHIVYISKYNKIFSLLCMVFGILIELFGILVFMPGLCYFSRQIDIILNGLQGVCMGFFQLSRLYYCFSKSKVHSNKGYSSKTFIFMYTIGILIVICFFISSWFVLHISNCSLDTNFNYIETHDDADNAISALFTKILIVVIFVYIIWDFATLTLYIWKLFSFGTFKKDQKEVYYRIRSILNRIIILTFFYQFTIIVLLNDILIEVVSKSSIIQIDSILVLVFLEGLVSTSISLAVFLMQQHNTDEYEKFLSVLRFCRIDKMCCFCESIITDQLNSKESEISKNTLEFQQNGEKMKYHNDNDNNVNDHKICIDKSSEDKNSSIKNTSNTSNHESHPTTTYTTNDISVDHGKIHIRGQNTQTLETANVNLEM